MQTPPKKLIKSAEEIGAMSASLTAKHQNCVLSTINALLSQQAVKAVKKPCSEKT